MTQARRSARWQYPVFINCRDRLSSLVVLLDWLEQAGQRNIYLVDNDSSYPPLLAFYERCPYSIIRLNKNMGHKAVWEAGIIERFSRGEYFIVTDPDIIPTEYCPLDAIELFRDCLDRFQEVTRVGFGLKIDDLPEHYALAESVRIWEGQFWTADLQIEPGLYRAPIDTTFSLHRPGAPHSLTGIRTGEPYVARHTAWYVNSSAPDDEEQYYREHMLLSVNHWNRDSLPDRLVEGLKTIAAQGRVDFDC